MPILNSVGMHDCMYMYEGFNDSIPMWTYPQDETYSSGGRLQIVFTCIDTKEPSRPYCLCVKITEDRSYLGRSVYPPPPNPPPPRQSVH